VTATDAGLMPLVMQLGCARTSTMDVSAVLGSVCSAIPGTLGVGGAVLLVLEPADGVRALTASDARAGWIGEMQQRAGVGPLPGAVRTWRPMLTADLTRIGSPAVAAAAAECGLVSSLVLPFEVDGDRLGVLQLLGEAQRPVEPAHADIVRPLMDVLAARLADVRALRRAMTGQSAGSRGTPSPEGPAAERPAERTAEPPAAERPTPDRPVPADRPTPVSPSPTPRRSRRGAHAAPEPGADPCGETTHALPAVAASRPSAGARPSPTPAPTPAKSGAHPVPEPRRPAAPRLPTTRPRAGRHSA
jgi:GAF domain